MTATATAKKRSWRITNPVLARELKQRMSTPRITLVLTCYLLVLGSAVFLLYRARSETNSQFITQPGISQFADIGQGLFEFVLFFMTLLVLFIVPGFTAASIAGERERQTLRPLQITLLSPLGIVVGKVAASAALTLLLLVASMPLLAVAYLIGGITFDEIFISLAVVLFSALALACITVACSALVKRVPGAILLAYGLVLALVFGSFAGYAIAREYDLSRGVDAASVPSWTLAANPLAAVAQVSDRSPAPDPEDEFFGPFGPGYSNSNSGSPLSAIRDFMNDSRWNGGGGFVEGPFPMAVPVDPFGNPIGQAQDFGAQNDDGDRLSFISEFLLTFTAIALLGLLVASRRIATPARTDR